MRFHIVVGNPPYQLKDKGTTTGSSPLYHLFIDAAKRLNPIHLCFITPSRWFTGGKGLSKFRSEMMNDKQISHLVDFRDSSSCFPGTSISGGVSYFLRSESHAGLCLFTSGGESHLVDLNEFPVVIRGTGIASVIRRIKGSGLKPLNLRVSPINVFGLPSFTRGSSDPFPGSIRVIHSKGSGFIDRKDTKDKHGSIKLYKVAISKALHEHAGQPGRSGKYKVLSRSFILDPLEVCTHSYLVVGLFKTLSEARNYLSYINTRFVRFLILQAANGINLSSSSFIFVPDLGDYTDAIDERDLYQKFGLSEKEKGLIESCIRC